MKGTIPNEDHYITRLIPIRLGGLLRTAYPKMKKAGLRDKFHEEAESCFSAVITFYDLAMESPRAAEIALEKLRTEELFSEREPDKLKLSLINLARIARDADVIYQEQGHDFALNMTMLSAHLVCIVKEAVEQKLQQEQTSLKSILKQPGTSAERATGKSASWADRVVADEGRK